MADESLEPNRVEIQVGEGETTASFEGGEPVPITRLGELPWWAALHVQAYQRAGIRVLPNPEPGDTDDR